MAWRSDDVWVSSRGLAERRPWDGSRQTDLLWSDGPVNGIIRWVWLTDTGQSRCNGRGGVDAMGGVESMQREGSEIG